MPFWCASISFFPRSRRFFFVAFIVFSRSSVCFRSWLFRLFFLLPVSTPTLTSCSFFIHLQFGYSTFGNRTECEEKKNCKRRSKKENETKRREKNLLDITMTHICSVLFLVKTRNFKFILFQATKLFFLYVIPVVPSSLVVFLFLLFLYNRKRKLFCDIR